MSIEDDIKNLQNNICPDCGLRLIYQTPLTGRMHCHECDAIFEFFAGTVLRTTEGAKVVQDEWDCLKQDLGQFKDKEGK